MVDLAGSERQDKTGAEGKLLKEGAFITKHNVVNDLFIKAPSFNSFPSAPVLSCLSLPAKSTIFNIDFYTLSSPPRSFFTLVLINVCQTLCDLELPAFILVAATARFFTPLTKTSKHSIAVFTSVSSIPLFYCLHHNFTYRCSKI
jgi:hypothetical protein